MNRLNFGDVLIRDKCLGIMHVGVCAGPGIVFHNSPDKGEHISTLEEFSMGKPVRAQPNAAAPADVALRIQQKLIQPAKYDLLTRNCEHSASEVVCGQSTSPTLDAVVVLSLFIASVSLLVKVK